ncbi:type II toxin-antitoxin system RelE/ParE family toxin [Pseudidiomarina homiensis]|uniref:Type II toxin-antitoxin system RelE/ParE family toxin n=1 Tax=Pseudidiomarina homiensis TaxID=364198 RepID=A0A432Y5J0_9GAMM|nr:type II toxin-antitoxin system RelE/ParE family toxin [Pseudidiomarina homiensis]RUO56193.1 hypothetical protein CWI70_05430 [Pseudidiomarina homiensis]
MTIAIDYTSRFKLQTRDWVKYLARDIGYRAAQRYIDNILDRFEQRVSAFPMGCSQCIESEVVGFGHYYEFIDTKAQVRIIYRLGEERGTHVSVLLFLRTRQNLRDQLFKLVLMTP